jgi:heme/copper-type cytochrome/quinol oxidase subunit 3
MGTSCFNAPKFEQTRVAFILTILFALLFTNLQANEYLEAEFSISDGIYGSVFFLITDFMDFTS